MRRTGILIAACLGFAPPALALDCPGETQAAMDQCADAAYRKADDALNKEYQEITRRLKDDTATAKLLVSAQKAWIAFRDAECAFSSSANVGGTIYPMVYSYCLERVTSARVKELGVYLKCAEGDLGCPVPGE